MTVRDDEFIASMQAMYAEMNETYNPAKNTKVIRRKKPRRYEKYINEPLSSLQRLQAASTNHRIAELKHRLANEREVISGMITTGTVTLVYAPSGAGKTVWVLGSLFKSIRNNLIKGSDVIYFNEDDGQRHSQKAEMGMKHGMAMITLANSQDPALRNADDALRMLSMIQKEGEADGKIIICDTLKKFASVLNKGEVADILHVFRSSPQRAAHRSSCWATVTSIDR